MLRKKHFHKEAVKVEAIPSGEPAETAFNDWLNWDPISSGEGDLLLDDMEKSFSIPKTVKENVKSIDFTSNMNGLPVHGLQIKDLIYGSGATVGPTDTDNQENGSTCFNDTKVGSHDFEASANFDHTLQISEEKLKYSIGLEANRSDDLEANLVTSETNLHDIPSLVHMGNASHNGEGLHITEINRLITNNHVSLELADKPTSAAFRLESTMENQCDIDVCEHKGIAVDIVSDKADIENIHVKPLAPSDASSQGVHVEGQYSKMSDNSVKLGDNFLVDGFKNVPTDSTGPIKDDVMGEKMRLDEGTSFKGVGKSLEGGILLSFY